MIYFLTRFLWRGFQFCNLQKIVNLVLAMFGQISVSKLNRPKPKLKKYTNTKSNNTGDCTLYNSITIGFTKIYDARTLTLQPKMRTLSICAGRKCSKRANKSLKVN